MAAADRPKGSKMLPGSAVCLCASIDARHHSMFAGRYASCHHLKDYFAGLKDFHGGYVNVGSQHTSANNTHLGLSVLEPIAGLVGVFCILCSVQD